MALRVRALVARLCYWPLLTLGVTLVAGLTFYAQALSSQKLNKALDEFCRFEIEPTLSGQGIKNYQQQLEYCQANLKRIHNSTAPLVEIQSMVEYVLEQAKDPSRNPASLFSSWLDRYARFKVTAPSGDLTAALQYPAGSWHIGKLFASVFAHADLLHLLNNLVFFLIFASLVERLLGRAKYLAVFIVLTLFSQGVYSLVYQFSTTPTLTYGLSGVLMGMLTLSAVLVTSTQMQRIHRNLFLLIWALVLAFLSADAVRLFLLKPTSDVNFLAHAAGAVAGLLLGLWEILKKPTQRKLSVFWIVPGLSAVLKILRYEETPPNARKQKLVEQQVLVDAAAQPGKSIPSLEHFILELFGAECQTKQKISVAQLRYLGETGKHASGYLLCADPVTIEFGRTLKVQTTRAPSITLAQVQKTLQMLNEHFKEQGLVFEHTTTEHWYVHLPHPLDATTPSPWDCQHRSLNQCLPQGKDAGQIRAWLNDIQMLMHQNHLTTKPVTSDLATWNSVWFWGDGVLPNAYLPRIDKVYTDEPWIKGLAILAGVSVVPLSVPIELTEATEGIHALLVYDHRFADLQSFPEGAAALEHVEELTASYLSEFRQAVRMQRLNSQLCLVDRDKQFYLELKNRIFTWPRHSVT